MELISKIIKIQYENKIDELMQKIDEETTATSEAKQAESAEQKGGKGKMKTNKKSSKKSSKKTGKK